MQPYSILCTLRFRSAVGLLNMNPWMQHYSFFRSSVRKNVVVLVQNESPDAALQHFSLFDRKKCCSVFEECVLLYAKCASYSRLSRKRTRCQVSHSLCVTQETHILLRASIKSHISTCQKYNFAKGVF